MFTKKKMLDQFRYAFKIFASSQGSPATSNERGEHGFEEETNSTNVYLDFAAKASDLSYQKVKTQSGSDCL